MNDRFRFRVWFTPDYQEPEMIYDAEQTYDNRCRKKGSYYHDSFGEILEDKDCVVMQCTGLKDKNGKLIYEADVVKFRNTDNKYYIGIIKYTAEDALFCLSYRNEKNRDDWDYVSRYRLEVIGNIYENPEFLEDNNG